MPPFKVTTLEKEEQRFAVNRLREAVVRLIDGGATHADEHFVQLLVERFVEATGEEWLSRDLTLYLLQPDRWAHADRIQLGTDLLNVVFMLDPRDAPELVGEGATVAYRAKELPPGVNPGPRRRRAPAGTSTRMSEKYHEIFQRHKLPTTGLPRGNVEDMQYRMGSDDWYVKVSGSWYWLDSPRRRSRRVGEEVVEEGRWVLLPYGPL